MSLISADVLQSIANTYFKVIDHWNVGINGVIGTCDSSTDSEMLTMLKDDLKTFKDKKYWMVLLQDDAYYVIFLNSTVTVQGENEEEEKKESWIRGMYQNTWTSSLLEGTYEIIENGDEEVSGLKLYGQNWENIFDFSTDDTAAKVIATLNGKVDNQFDWNKNKRDAFIRNSNITDDVESDDAVVFNGANMKDSNEQNDFSFASDTNKYDNLKDIDFGDVCHDMLFKGCIVLEEVPQEGSQSKPRRYSTLFGKYDHKVNDVDYITILFTSNFGGNEVYQMVDIPKSNLILDGDGEQYIVTLPIYSGLEGSFKVTMMFCKIDEKHFKVEVDNGEIKDPRSYLFKDPATGNEIANYYVGEVTKDMISIIPEYRKFYKESDSSGPIFYALSNDVENNTIPKGLVTLRVDEASTDSAMYFVWNGEGEGEVEVKVEKRIIYSNAFPIRYDGTNRNYTPGEVTIEGNTLKGKLSIPDLSILNYYIEADGCDDIHAFPLEFKTNTEGSFKEFKTLIPLLKLGGIGSHPLMSYCYTSSIQITSNQYKDMGLVKCATDFAGDIDDGLKGLTFDEVNILTTNKSKYTIIFQLELKNIDAYGKDNSYYGGDTNNKPNEGGTNDTRYVLIYISKGSDSTDVSVVEKWNDSGEIGCYDSCKISIGNTIELTYEDNGLEVKATINETKLIVPRKGNFESGIPLNAKATFTDPPPTEDDGLNYYDCKIVAIYGVDNQDPGTVDNGFFTIFSGNLDMRVEDMDYSKDFNSNYNDFERKVHGYIASKGETELRTIDEVLNSETIEDIKSYYLITFIRYKYDYEITEETNKYNPSVYHYHTSLLKYIPNTDEGSVEKTANGNNLVSCIYKKGTVTRIVFGKEGNQEFTYNSKEDTEEDSDNSYIKVYIDEGTKIIAFRECMVNTLNPIRINEVNAINVVENTGNDIQDYILNNGCNIYSVGSYDGANTRLFPLDYDGKQKEITGIVATAYIKCIPVKEN